MLLLSASYFAIDQQWSLGKSLVSLLLSHGLSRGADLQHSVACSSLIMFMALQWDVSLLVIVFVNLGLRRSLSMN